MFRHEKVERASAIRSDAPFHARYLTIDGPSPFPCARAPSEDARVQECFALTREHDSALNARGSLFYFYSFVSDSFSSAVE